jgi:hypothetical protein
MEYTLYKSLKQTFYVTLEGGGGVNVVSKAQLIIHQFSKNQLVDEMVTSAAAVHNNCLNTGPCFHVCEGLNCETHCGMGDLGKDDLEAYPLRLLILFGCLDWNPCELHGDASRERYQLCQLAPI